MRLVEIKPRENGAHRNQTIDSMSSIPEGWAVIPDDMDTPNFPFGDVATSEIDGVMTVVEWTPGIIPEPEPTPEVEEEPTANEILNALLGVSE